MVKLKVTIDRENCVGCGNCESVCPEVFKLSPEDDRSQVDESLEECVRTAEEECPVEAIEVVKMAN